MKFLVPILFVMSVSAQQWNRVPVTTTASFRGLSVVSDNVVWASGTDGTVIRTLNGGKSWSVMTVAGAEKLDFRGIHAFDEHDAVIISSGPAEKGQARIYRTSDGGKNWIQVFEEKRAGIFLDAIAFWDRRHGIVLSDSVDGHFALFTTNDGGSTWNQIPAAALPPALPNEGAFAASNSCLAVQGRSNVWFATGGAGVARVFRSGDLGRTWAVAETPMHPKNASSGIFSLAFSDANNGVAVGGDYQRPQSSDLPNVLGTRDGGKTWQIGGSTNPAGVYLSSAVVLPLRAKTDFVFGGTAGLFMRTILSHGGWMRVSRENLNAVAVSNSATGLSVWAVGPNGLVIREEMQFLSR